MYIKFCIFYFLINCLLITICTNQYGPDPWQYESSGIHKDASDIPPDLNLPLPKKSRVEINGLGDWFFKRIVAILLKGGQVKRNEDNSIDISIQMKFPEEQWKLLNEYTTSKSALTEEMLRRSVGYVEEAFYKPTLTEKIAMAWSDYIQVYLSFFKTEITWTLGILSIAVTVLVLYQRMSHKHMMVVLFLGIYAYEVFVSYMESERQEYENFIKAVNRCKWYFWSDTCQVPGPDPIVFLKHMHPLKICLRIFSTIITEPMIYISNTIHSIISGMTDGLWYPLNSIVYSILVLILNFLVIVFLIMILFNFILNIPFNLSFFAGLVNIGVNQRKRSLLTESVQANMNNEDRLSGPNLHQLLNLVTKVVDKSENRLNVPVQNISSTNVSNKNRHIRSSSAGRVTDFLRLPYETNENSVIRNRSRGSQVGDGDYNRKVHQ